MRIRKRVSMKDLLTLQDAIVFNALIIHGIIDNKLIFCVYVIQMLVNFSFSKTYLTCPNFMMCNNIFFQSFKIIKTFHMLFIMHSIKNLYFHCF